MMIYQIKSRRLALFLVCLLAASCLTLISCGHSTSGVIDVQTLPMAFEGMRMGGISGAPPVDVEINVDMPTLPNKAMTYKVKPMESAYANELVLKIGFEGPAESHLEPSDTPNPGSVAFSFTEGDATLTISYHGYLEARFGEYPSTFTKANILSQQECVEIAKDWLKSHDIYPDNVTRISTGPMRQIATVDTETGIISDNKILTYGVSFFASIGDYESSLPAAFVEIAENGAIIELDLHSQRIETYGYVNLKTPETALEILRTVLASPLPDPPEAKECLVNMRSFDNLSVTEISLKYSKHNEFIQPIYYFRGDASDKDSPGMVEQFTGRVDAVDRSR